MDKKESKKCIVCGKELENKEKGRKRKYCGEKCSREYHKKKNANKKKQTGGKAKCQNCGKEFIRADKSTRKCCTRMCEQALGRRDEVKTLRQMAREEKERKEAIELRSFALELNDKGYGRKAITEALELRPQTLKNWIRHYTRDRHGNWRQKPRYRRSGRNNENKYSYTETKDSGEWLSKLREKVIEESCIEESMLLNRPIHIICSVTNILKDAYQLSSIIQARLQMNPLDGAVYAFCGMKRDKIRYMFWDGDGFTVVSKRRERGSYPWPSPKLGSVLTISAQDFGLILKGTRRQNRIQDWHSLDFSTDI